MAEKKVTRAEKTRARRRKRGAMGLEANLKLHVPQEKKDENFVYRWARGTPDRMSALTQYDDYDVVTDADLSDDDKQNGLGVNPQRHGGVTDKGDPFNLVLLRKPKDFYEEDQREKNQLVDARENELKRGAVEHDGQSGLSGSHAYTPSGSAPSISHNGEA